MGGTYETACRGKDKHRTKVDADHQAVKRNGKTKTGKRLNSYRCDFCHYWHVGNSTHAKRTPYKRQKWRLK